MIISNLLVLIAVATNFFKAVDIFTIAFIIVTGQLMFSLVL